MTKKDLEQYFIPSLTLLETDLTETELLFRKIIFTEQAFPSQKRQPAYGPEEAGYVFFRWSYELPGGPFTGLKKLILEIRRRTGLRSSYRGIVGIDVTPARRAFRPSARLRKLFYSSQPAGICIQPGNIEPVRSECFFPLRCDGRQKSCAGACGSAGRQTSDGEQNPSGHPANRI